MNNKCIINHIENNKPIFIKNYFDKNENINKLTDIIKLIKSKQCSNLLLKGGIVFKYSDIYIFEELIEKINKKKNIIICDYLRSWNHNKNNVTRWHYDGDGCDVINVCLSGKKKFILSEPMTHINYPFSNISIVDLNKKKYEYILEPGDLLLIPKFWYHKVITLENNTQTINLLLVQKKTKIPENIKTNYLIHTFFKTKMSKIIFLEHNKVKQSINLFIIYYIKEIFQLFLAALILHKTNVLKNNINKGLALISLILLNIMYNKDSLGIILIATIHTIALFVFLMRYN